MVIAPVICLKYLKYLKGPADSILSGLWAASQEYSGVGSGSAKCAVSFDKWFLGVSDTRLCLPMALPLGLLVPPAIWMRVAIFSFSKALKVH